MKKTKILVRDMKAIKKALWTFYEFVPMANARHIILKEMDNIEEFINRIGNEGNK